MHPHCHTIQERFADYLDRSLPLAEREAVEAHAAACGPCRNALAMSREMVAALAEVPAPELPDGYGDRFAARLEALPAPRARAARPWRRPAGRPAFPALAGWGRALAGVAAGVLLTLAFVSYGTHFLAPGGAHLPVPSAGPGPVPAATPVADRDAMHVPMGEDSTVRVFFDAARAVDHVTFAIELPDGVRVISDGRVVDLGRIEWEGALAEGRNVLTIPVRGVTRGAWSLKASIQRGGARREQSVDLLVNGA